MSQELENRELLELNPTLETHPTTDIALLLDIQGDISSMNEEMRTAIIRAVMDTHPEFAANLLKSRGNIHGTVSSILQWIESLEDTSTIVITKLQGLIDTLNINGQIIILLEIILEKNKEEERGFDYRPLLELAALDGNRLKLLFDEAKKSNNVEFTRALLKVTGARISLDTNKNRNVNSYFAYGLAEVAIASGNPELIQIVINAIADSQSTIEMLLKGSFLTIFDVIAEYGTIADLKRFIDLAVETEKGNDTITYKTRQYSVQDITNHQRKALQLPEDIDITGLLLLHKNAFRYLIGSKQPEKLQFILDILRDNPTYIKIIADKLYKELYRDSQWRKESKGCDPDRYEVPDSIEKFIADIKKAINDKQEESRLSYQILINLFGRRPLSSKATAISTQVKTSQDIPSEYDENCYQRLLSIMGIFDQMNKAEGIHIEWARRLTIIFNDSELAIKYIKAAMQWVLKDPNLAIWRHLTNIINTKDIHYGQKAGYIKGIDAINAVMGFDFPSERFDTNPWREMLIKHPEASRYICIAPEIEKYINENDLQFPTNIEELRSIVLEVDIKKCNFSKEIADRLRSKLKQSLHDIMNPEETEVELEINFTMMAVTPNTIRDCLKRLTIMGVLNETAVTIWAEHISQKKPRYIKLDQNGKATQAESSELGVINSSFESYATRISPENSNLNDIALLIDILREGKAIESNANRSLRIDLTQFTPEQRLEFTKQVCIMLIKDEETINKILLAKSIEEVFKISDPSGNLYFIDDSLMLELGPLELNSDLYLDKIRKLNEFVKNCMVIIHSNGGKAKNSTSTGSQIE